MPQTYTRDREALSTGSDGAIRILKQYEPRIDETKGFLFGLQGGNRLNSNGSVSEAFNLWTASGGASVVVNALEAPVDRGGQTADTITLPAGASLSTSVGAPHLGAESAGPILGQIWIRPTSSSGTLRFSHSGSTIDVPLSTLTADTWNHVPLNGLTTDARDGTFTMTATGESVTFGAWGANLTQISNGGDTGSFHLDPVAYDRSSDQTPIDVLDVTTPIAQSTATTGFCLSVDAQPYDGLAWNAPVVLKRGLVGWYSSKATQATASLYLTGTHTKDAKPIGSLCFYVNGSEPEGAFSEVCGPAPSDWSPGSPHNVKGCVSADRHMRVYADDQQIADHALVSATVVPDLHGGHLVVGNATEANAPAWAPDPSVPWNGYVSKALACYDGVDRSDECR